MSEIIKKVVPRVALAIAAIATGAVAGNAIKHESGSEKASDNAQDAIEYVMPNAEVNPTSGRDHLPKSEADHLGLSAKNAIHANSSLHQIDVK